MPKKSLKKSETENEVLRLRAENLGLTNLVEELKEKLAVKKELEIIDIGLNDPSPKDEEKRMSYVEQVALLHENILHPKLKQMIAVLHVDLENKYNERDVDCMLKGAVYALREMIRWGEIMVGEYEERKKEITNKDKK